MSVYFIKDGRTISDFETMKDALIWLASAEGMEVAFDSYDDIEDYDECDRGELNS